jgi:uncharacterized protein
VVILVVLVGVALYMAASIYILAQAARAARTLTAGTPADLGLDFEAVSFESAGDGIPLHGWYLPANGNRAIIMVHGIDQNRWNSWEHVPQKAQFLVRHGFDVLVFDLRGHGESGGDRLGFGWLERNDVRGAVSFVESRGYPAGRIGILSHSYGAATSLLSAAAIPDVAAVVADSAFADLRLLLNREVRLRGFPPIFAPGIALAGSTLHRINLKEIAPVHQVAKIAPRPILFIHGEADERIPVAHSKQLFLAAHNPANELWIVPGAAHVQTFAQQPELYADKVLAFFDANLK